jgi:hypothetical protein
MARMVRKQLYIDAELDKALAARAAATGESQAEIVRTAVSRYLAGNERSTRDAAVDTYLRLVEETRRSGAFTMGGPIPSKEELHEREGWHPDR